ncbi:hypothetical protein ON010_g18868 [Phytophthora cinnamomi]|nr:hypothetical protein ON010_g18868 [Phytophthora cinnamomi]
MPATTRGEPDRECKSGFHGDERTNYEKTVGVRTTVPVRLAVANQSQDPADVRGEGGDRPPKLRQRFGPEDGYLLAVQVNTGDLYATRRASSTSSRSPSRGNRAPPVPFGAEIFEVKLTLLGL